MTTHVCPYGHPPCGHVADMCMEFDDGHRAWFCREHATMVAARTGARAVDVATSHRRLPRWEP